MATLKLIRQIASATPLGSASRFWCEVADLCVAPGRWALVLKKDDVVAVEPWSPLKKRFAGGRPERLATTSPTYRDGHRRRRIDATHA